MELKRFLRRKRKRVALLNTGGSGHRFGPNLKEPPIRSINKIIKQKEKKTQLLLFWVSSLGGKVS